MAPIKTTKRDSVSWLGWEGMGTGYKLLVTWLATVFDTKVGMPLRSFSLKMEDDLIGRYPYTVPDVQIMVQRPKAAAEHVTHCASMHGLKISTTHSCAQPKNYSTDAQAVRVHKLNSEHSCANCTCE